MKKYLFIAMACVVSFAFSSCGHEEPTEDTKDHFTFKVSDVTYNAASITVSCDDAEAYFYWDVVSKEELADYADLAEYLTEYFYTPEFYEENADLFEQYYGITSWEDLASIFMLQGTDTYDYDGLTANTTYVVWACKVDANLNVVGNIESTEFQTAEVSTIDLSFSLADDDTAVYLIPSDLQATYLAAVIATDTLTAYDQTPQSYFELYLDYYAQVLEAYAAYGITWADVLFTNTIYLPKSELLEGEETHFIAAGVVDGVVNSALCDLTYTLAATPSAPLLSAAAPAKRYVARPVMEQKNQMLQRKALKVIK